MNNPNNNSKSFLTPYRRHNNSKNSLLLNNSIDSKLSKGSKGRNSVNRSRGRRFRNRSKEGDQSAISYNYRADDAEYKFLQEVREVKGIVLLKLFVNVRNS